MSSSNNQTSAPSSFFPSSSFPRHLDRCSEASCRDRPFMRTADAASPPDRTEIGRAGWLLLHTFAANFATDKELVAAATTERHGNVGKVSGNGSGGGNGHIDSGGNGSMESNSKVNGGLSCSSSSSVFSCSDDLPLDRLRSIAWVWACMYTYPCHICRESVLEMVKGNPPNDFAASGTNREMSLWMCKLHNEVNAELGKRRYSCNATELLRRYGQENGRQE
eukprot:GHVS01027095.1.p1 GENE.GHVS01027095.1~~GHVS01027095.1.p1  ORF type:complete len:221 (+),score=45.65 GHVS01027095.1:266-928(+)